MAIGASVLASKYSVTRTLTLPKTTNTSVFIPCAAANKLLARCMHYSEKFGRRAAELFLFREGGIMTQRRLLIGCAVAAVIAFAGIQSSALAQNNAEKDSKAASSD